MRKFKPTLFLIEGILARIPEGFIRQSALAKRVFIHNKQGTETIKQVLAEGKVAREGDYFYDSTRVSPEQVRELSKRYRPALPYMSPNGTLPESAISARREARQLHLEHNGNSAMLRLIGYLDETPGFAKVENLGLQTADEPVLQTLLQDNILRQVEYYIFDPLRVGQQTVNEAIRREKLEPLQEALNDFLKAKPGQTASQVELIEKFGEDVIKELLMLGSVTTFNIQLKTPPYTSTWVRPKGSDSKKAKQTAIETMRIKDEAWESAREVCGEVLRPGGRDGKSLRMQVIARSYTVNAAAKRLSLHLFTMEQAVKKNLISSFADPEGRTRLPAVEVETAFENSDYLERIAALEVLTAREIATVAGVSYSTLRSRLLRANISRTEPRWGQVRGRWRLPHTLREFQEQLQDRFTEINAEREAQVAEQNRLRAEQRERERIIAELERRRREELRARLVASFPTWRHDRRADQRIFLHIGPPNSGKTHDALSALETASIGWYLAPLRLLAFEIFDRLNQRGIYCNLLTGEEYIPVPGASITAATIEMFNPSESGDCIIIDEAQMLADPDRGWAWTRALMEAQAPEIHVIGPPTAQELIQRLAGAAAIPLNVIEHDRLAPIQVAERHWPLTHLPARTILIAFSRQTVLHLKTDLEQMGRSVSVVYGNLPPEVRRRQADRFASGQTEICVATDAVGMGLNLPADYVCFYEIEKFDGRDNRILYPAEVQQIGGRAGRFGYSTVGEVGATTKRDLNLLRKLFYTPAEMLTHARVAPSVEDLEMIPGSLHERLAQWASLGSIPESLRGAIKTADLTERIELAKMLTDQQVEQLGLAAALKLVNAPTRQNTREYWYDCAQAILGHKPMPLPPDAPAEVMDSFELEITETCIACADIYLWLSQRHEFAHYGLHHLEVRKARANWSQQIDLALLRKVDTARRCAQCGRPLPVNYRYKICDRCYSERYRYYDDYDYR
jgi:hypothetical protein